MAYLREMREYRQEEHDVDSVHDSLILQYLCFTGLVLELVLCLAHTLQQFVHVNGVHNVANDDCKRQHCSKPIA